MKKLLFIFLSICMLFVGCGTTSTETTTETYTEPLATATVAAEDVTDTLTLKVFKAGKADAILITVGDQTVLIDTGEDDEGDDILKYLSKHNIDTIDYLIITHFDKDHVGGADKVLEGVTVNNVIEPDYESTSNQYEEYVTALAEAGITPTKLSENMTFTLGCASFTILPAETNYAEEYGEGTDDDSDSVDNLMSLVISVVHGDNSFLLAGDATEERLQELIDLGNIEHTFLKVPHHGNYETLSSTFLSAVNPEYAVITCSKSDGGDDKLINLLDSLGTTTYLTYDGSVTATSDGTTLTVEQ